MRPFPVIAGPTASGKTDLALAIARGLAGAGLGPGEIVTADSMQVYRGMDIGTAKPTAAQRFAAPHHLLDIREPTESFSVDEWLALAEETIDAIRARGGTPIVVGGSHLYIRALLEGLFEGPPPDPALRALLSAMDPAERRAELERVDPDAAARIHPNDVRRAVRALEVHRLAGKPISALQSQWDAARARPDALFVTLEWPAEALSRRINARVKAMAEEGLVAEAWSLWAAERLGRQAREGLGYKQLADAFEELARVFPKEGPPPGTDHPRVEAALEQTKVQTRRFAKNQRTWLRRLSLTPAPGMALALEPQEASSESLATRVQEALRRAG